VSRIRVDPLDDSSHALRDAAAAILARAFANPERYSVDRIARELEFEASPLFYRQFFVAMRSGEVLGVGGVKAADWASHTHLLYLSAVAPEWRGQGIGRALVKARIEWVESRFASGRLLVSTDKVKRFRELGFSEIRHSNIDGRRLMLRRF